MYDINDGTIHLSPRQHGDIYERNINVTTRALIKAHISRGREHIYILKKKVINVLKENGVKYLTNEHLENDKFMTSVLSYVIRLSLKTE